MELQPQAACDVWVGWQSAIAMLGMRDLESLVKRAFDCGFIDSDVRGFDDFEEDLRQAIEHPDGSWPLQGHEYALFGNTIDELSKWYWFTPQYREDRERWWQQAEIDLILSQPYENPFRGIGRNDPCPCGSGNKFKKCCLE